MPFNLISDGAGWHKPRAISLLTVCYPAPECHYLELTGFMAASCDDTAQSSGSSTDLGWDDVRVQGDWGSFPRRDSQWNVGWGLGFWSWLKILVLSISSLPGCCNYTFAWLTPYDQIYLDKLKHFVLNSSYWKRDATFRVWCLMRASVEYVVPVGPKYIPVLQCEHGPLPNKAEES